MLAQRRQNPGDARQSAAARRPASLARACSCTAADLLVAYPQRFSTTAVIAVVAGWAAAQWLHESGDPQFPPFCLRRILIDHFGNDGLHFLQFFVAGRSSPRGAAASPSNSRRASVSSNAPISKSTRPYLCQAADRSHRCPKPCRGLRQSAELERYHGLSNRRPGLTLKGDGRGLVPRAGGRRACSSPPH